MTRIEAPAATGVRPWEPARAGWVPRLKRLRYLALTPWRLTKVALFDNYIPVATNLRYLRYHRRARFASRGALSATRDAEVRRSVASLRQAGYCIVPPHLEPHRITEIATEVDARFADPQAHADQHNPHAVQLFTHLEDPIASVPAILEFLTPRISAVLESYLGSHMRIVSAAVYRSEAHEDPRVGSWLWHSDDHPGCLTKIMVYLSGATGATGAFRAVPRPRSRWLKLRGFHDRYFAGKFHPEINDPANHVVMEGPPGTTVVFDNNLIHRARPPERGHRDVAVFLVMPATEPWRVHFDRVGGAIGRPKAPAYPPNPLRG